MCSRARRAGAVHLHIHRGDFAVDDVKERVRKFVIEKFAQGRSVRLDDRTSLIETDLLDSTAVLELASFLQESFGIAISDEELVPANLDSVDAIAAFVMQK